MATTGPRSGRAAKPAANGPAKLRGLRQQQRAELRDHILATARALIAEEGFEGLSLRKLAQALGCSPMALYAYFADKHALLWALAQDGFGLLARRLARGAPADPRAALRRVYVEYARLGFERPDEYRILFMTPVGASAAPSAPGAVALAAPAPKSPDALYGGNPAFAVSRDRVQACLDAGVLRGDPHAIATLLWTTVHGAVAAVLTFPDFPFGDPAAYAARVVDLALTALGADLVAPLAPGVPPTLKGRSS